MIFRRAPRGIIFLGLCAVFSFLLTGCSKVRTSSAETETPGRAAVVTAVETEKQAETVETDAAAVSGGETRTNEAEPAVNSNRAAVTSEAKVPIDSVGFAPVTDKNEYLAWMQANTDENPEYLDMRWNRLQQDNYYHPDNTPEVRQAFLRTPREDFVRPQNLARVYDHAALPIEDGQTIGGPHLVIRMTNSLDLHPGQKVLEIGTGSGYQSAVLSFLTGEVYTIEIKPNLFGITDRLYTSLEDRYPTYKNIIRRNADGYYGWEEYAPFDRIVVTCGIDHIPPDLLKQLKPGGIMIIPIGPMTGEQVILKITKNVDENGVITLQREDIYDGKVTQAFVPFVADDGSWHQEKQ